MGIEEIEEFCNKMGFECTINRNPSPEEIERIRTKIKDNEEKIKIIQAKYEKGI